MKKISHFFGMKRKTDIGFTLVELMVVITIISLLTGIIVTNLTPPRAKARDAKRISDMGHLQLALELYFDRCREYPSAVDGESSLGVDINSSCITVKLSDYISKIPQPSPEKETNYNYFVNSDKSDYILRAQLENYNEVLKDGLSSVSGSDNRPSWAGANDDVSCDNSSTGGKYEYCLSPK